MTETALSLQSLVTSWVQALSVAIAAAAFVYTLVRSRRLRAVERYEDITSRFVEFLKTCREHPDLDLGPLPSLSTDEDEARIERVTTAALLEGLILLERIYVLQSLKLSPARLRSNVLGEMVKEYAAREPFLVVWERARGWFHVPFAEFVDGVIDRCLIEEGNDPRGAKSRT